MRGLKVLSPRTELCPFFRFVKSRTEKKCAKDHKVEVKVFLIERYNDFWCRLFFVLSN